MMKSRPKSRIILFFIKKCLSAEIFLAPSCRALFSYLPFLLYATPQCQTKLNPLSTSLIFHGLMEICAPIRIDRIA
jgi:hypothetical protein